MTLQRRFRYFEWVALIFAAATQLAWCFAAMQADWLVYASFALLLVFFISTFFTPTGTRNRLTLLICQALIICAASAMGAHHFYYLILFVLAAKAAILLSRNQMLLVGGIILICHFAAGQFSQYAVRHIHQKRHPVLSFYREEILEGDTYLFFLVSLATVTLLGRNLLLDRERRRAEEKLSAEVAQLAINVERARIAREMHDGLGHSLTSAKIQLELVLKALEENDVVRAGELIARGQAASSASLHEVRRAVRTAQHGVLTLKQSILMLIDEIKQQSPLLFKVQLEELSLAPKAQHQVFSIAKECLTNIRKHSSASEVELSLSRTQDGAQLTVRDNGKGFDKNSGSQSGFGLKGLQERADIIGAKVSIKSEPGKGSRVILSFPLG